SSSNVTPLTRRATVTADGQQEHTPPRANLDPGEVLRSPACGVSQPFPQGRIRSELADSADPTVPIIRIEHEALDTVAQDFARAHWRRQHRKPLRHRFHDHQGTAFLERGKDEYV